MKNQVGSSGLETWDASNSQQIHSIDESGQLRQEFIPLHRNVGMQTRMVLIVTSCLFYFGFNRAMIAAVVNSKTIKEFQQIFNFTGNPVVVHGFLSIMISIGALCGAIASSFFMTYYSPKSILLVTSCCALVFTVVTIYTEISFLMVFRLLIGWTIGTYLAMIPSFIKDITSKNVAPYFGTAPVINQSLGGLVAFMVGYELYQATGSIEQTWTIMCCICCIPLIIVIICLKLDIIYESPLYLLKAGKRKKAQKIYEQIYQPSEVGKIMKQKQTQLKRFHFNQLKLQYIRQFSSILRRKDMIIAVHLPMLRRMTGILIILLSSGSMIKAIDPRYETIAPTFTSLIYFISCFMSNLLVKFLPRRVIFQLGTISICISNLVITITYWLEYSPIIVLVFQGFILIIYGLTLGPIVWPYLTEVVPARVIPLAQSMNWVIDCFTLFLPGVIIADKDNPWPMFAVFFVWDFCSIFINHFFIVETKDKTTKEIIESLDRK